MDIAAGYKQTELGPIPEDWELRSANDISSPVRGGSPRPAGDSKYFNGSFIPWLTVASLTNILESQLVVSETSSCLTEEGSLHSRTLEEGTLIIANSGATLGVAKILGIRCCANDGIAALLNLNKAVSPYYLAHFINTRTDYLREIVATGNGQPNLNTALIGNFKIPLPPTITEQDAIAEVLCDADTLIESLEHIIVKTRQINQGVKQELLAGTNRLPGFEADWKTTTLGTIAHVSKGRGLSKSVTSEYGSKKCLLYGELFTTYGTCIEEIVSRTDSADGSLSCAGDVLLPGSTTTTGIDLAKASALMEDDVAIGGDVNIIRPRAEYMVCSVFLANYLTEVKKNEIAERTQGTTIIHLYGRDLLDLELRLPAIDEQESITAILTDMDEEIAAVRAKLSKTRQVKKGMMQQLLTGRIRLV